MWMTGFTRDPFDEKCPRGWQLGAAVLPRSRFAAAAEMRRIQNIRLVLQDGSFMDVEVLCLIPKNLPSLYSIGSWSVFLNEDAFSIGWSTTTVFAILQPWSLPRQDEGHPFHDPWVSGNNSQKPGCCIRSLFVHSMLRWAEDFAEPSIIADAEADYCWANWAHLSRQLAMYSWGCFKQW